MSNSIFLCSLNGWMILTLKRIPWTWISVVSLGSRVCQPKLEPFFLTKKLPEVGDKYIYIYMDWTYSDGDWESFGNELVQMWRWFLKIDWKQLVQIAIQLRSWLYLGICCAPSTLRINLGIPAFHEFWEPTSWCPFSCVSNRHQLVPSDPAPKTHAHLVAGQPPILKTFNVKPTSKITTQKKEETFNFTLHRLHVWHRMLVEILHFLGDDFSPRIPWTPSALLKSWAATAEKTVPPWRKHLAGEFVRVDKNRGFWMFFVSKADFTSWKIHMCFSKKGRFGKMMCFFFSWMVLRFERNINFCGVYRGFHLHPHPPAGMGGMPGAQTSLYSFSSLVNLRHSI